MKRLCLLATQALTFEKARLLSAHKVMSLVAMTLAERCERKSRATSPNSHPGCLWILTVLPSTCNEQKCLQK